MGLLRVCGLLWCLLVVWPGGACAQDVTGAGALTAFNPAIAFDIATYCNGADQGLDNSCAATWLAAAEAARASNGGQVHVSASPGTYRLSGRLLIPNGQQWHLKCADPHTTVFQGTGTTSVLLSLDPSSSTGEPWSDVSIENCGFDLGGFDLQGQSETFASTIDIEDASHVTVRGNRVFDSVVQPGRMCRLYSQCQRQHITALGGDYLLIEQNSLEGGGRIKAGRPGNHVLIQDNVITNINDNAITVVDGGTSTHFVIQRNLITMPIGSGIFFGSDGESAGDANTTHTDFTIRDNVVIGDWGTSCVMAMLGNHAARIMIARNLCIKTGALGSFTTGITVRRNNTGVLTVTDVTVRDNVLAAPVSPNVTTAGYFLSGSYADLCLLGNQYMVPTDSGIAIYWRPNTGVGLAHGNDVHGGNIRKDAPVTVTENADYSSCFVPTVIGTTPPEPGLGTGEWPTVTITGPTSSPSLTMSTDLLTTLAGTASAGTTEVRWECRPGCGSGLAQGTTSWTIPVVRLQGDVNQILVTARDGGTPARRGLDQLVVLYTPSTSRGRVVPRMTLN